MVRIRMQRHGRTHRPFFRITAVDRREKRNGKCLENLGWYDPCARDETKRLLLKEDRIRDWLGRGAQPSDTVRDLLGHNGLLSDKAKAEWEADRKVARDRVTARKSVERAEAALASLGEMVGGAAADLSSFVAGANAAAKDAKAAVSAGDIAKAAAAAEQAEGFLTSAKASEEKAQAAKAAAEAKAKADEEAAKAAEVEPAPAAEES